MEGGDQALAVGEPPGRRQWRHSAPSRTRSAIATTSSTRINSIAAGCAPARPSAAPRPACRTRDAPLRVAVHDEVLADTGRCAAGWKLHTGRPPACRRRWPCAPGRVRADDQVGGFQHREQLFQRGPADEVQRPAVQQRIDAFTVFALERRRAASEHDARAVPVDEPPCDLRVVRGTPVAVVAEALAASGLITQTGRGPAEISPAGTRSSASSAKSQRMTRSRMPGVQEAEQPSMTLLRGGAILSFVNSHW